jgi:NADH-quinone oxidoreductase subunit C
MDNEGLKIKIAAFNPDIVFEEPAPPATGWLQVNIEPSGWLPLARQLRNDPELNYDFLFCVTCIDWKTHLTMVYHLDSTQYRHPIVIRVKLDRIKPDIESVASIWRTADFHERESYEMFGVNFLNHPDLRLLILPDGWEGKFPMRKDFEDPVNMIKL